MAVVVMAELDTTQVVVVQVDTLALVVTVVEHKVQPLLSHDTLPLEPISGHALLALPVSAWFAWVQVVQAAQPTGQVVAVAVAD